MDDYNEKVDRITDEFMQLFLNEVRDNEDLTLEKDSLDEEDFKDKFPFNLIEEVKTPEPPKVITQTKVVEEKKEVNKKQNAEDEMRQKYEADVKKIDIQTKDIESYIKMLVQNINKKELIDMLEKPIE